MKKNGFVFVESVVVLVVVALSLATLISSYSLIKRKTQEKEYYDKASDKYLLYSISNIGTNERCNYGIDCKNHLQNISANTYRNSSNHISFRADKDNDDNYDCTKSKLGALVHDCNTVFEEFNLEHIYVVDNIVNELNKQNDISGSKTTTEFFDSGTIEYMKSLKKCNDLNYTVNQTTCESPIIYLIGVFQRNRNEYYYASIEVGIAEPTQDTVEEHDGWYWYNRNASPSLNLDQQIWYYYVDGEPLKGLHLLPTGNGRDVYYYYYFDNTGVMQMGWVYYNDAYHLFSPFDIDGGGHADGRRIQSCNSSTRAEVPITTSNGVKTYYFDSEGVCYKAATGNSLCDENDSLETILSFPMEDYYKCTYTP